MSQTVMIHNDSDEQILAYLLKQTAAGDEHALEQLYRKTNRLVYAYLTRVFGNKSLVDDVLVDTFTEVWKSAANFKGHAKITTWIIGIARNLAMNYLRRNKNHDDIADHTDLAETSGDQLEAENVRQITRKALDKLNPQQREILGLVLLPEMKYPDIAILLDIPLNTVKTRVHYAKEALKEQLLAMGVTAYDV